MKKTGLLLLVAGLILTSASVAYANYGVHAAPENTVAPYFAPLTSGCAGCHRAHTAVVSKLGFAAGIDQPIAESSVPNTSPSAFCLVCHGSSGSLADTDVINGVFLKNRKVPNNPPNPSVNNGRLNGGGFNQIGATSPCTSIHKVEGTTTTAWGWDDGGIGSDKQSGYAPLACGDCHDPHGSYNYRLLAAEAFTPNPDPANFTGKVDSNEDNWHSTAYSPNYTENSNPLIPTDHYKNPPNRGTGGISKYCIACHRAYTTDGQYETITYDPQTSAYVWMTVWRFRHNIDTANLGKYAGLQKPLITTLPLDKATKATSQDATANYLNCLTCHYAHGTDVTMDKEAKNIPPASTPGHDSTLLRRKNREVCEDCHKK